VGNRTETTVKRDPCVAPAVVATRHINQGTQWHLPPHSPFGLVGIGCQAPILKANVIAHLAHQGDGRKIIVDICN